MNVKRQAEQTNSPLQNATAFFRLDGFIVFGCGQEATFVLDEQRLTADGRLFSAPEMPFDEFTPIEPPGPIDRAFSLENGILRWRNQAFLGGQALFCNLNGFVTVIFNGVYPDNCPPIRLAEVPLDGKSDKFLRLPY